MTGVLCRSDVNPGWDNRSGPGGAANTGRDLTTTSTARRHVMAERQPTLTPLQQLLLIRSVAGHITADTTPQHAQTALDVIRSTLDGRDPVAGDG